jgi:hypothetical protein
MSGAPEHRFKSVSHSGQVVSWAMSVPHERTPKPEGIAAAPRLTPFGDPENLAGNVLGE